MEGRRGGGGGVLIDTAFLFGMMKIFLKDRVMRVGQICECTKNYGTSEGQILWCMDYISI